jgi:hypothetical protein
MSFDPQDRQRKNYILRRSIMDYGRGVLISCFGIFLVFASRFGYYFDPLIRYGFGALCLLYGGYRIYCGYKKNYFSE